MRIEHDFLGEMELPEEVYYGVQTMRAIENFPITGQRLDDEFIVALAVIKRAAAAANISTGRLEGKIGTAIITACDEIISGKWHDQFMVDPIQGGAGTSMNMNTNEVIANRALEILGEKKGDYRNISPNNHINMAQSTNDVVPTAIRITAMRKTRKLITELGELINTFDCKAQEFEQVLKMGRTHLQDAVPITLGQEFRAYANLISRGTSRIRSITNKLLSINIGATAVGTGLNAEVEYIQQAVAEIRILTGEEFRSAENLVDATQNTDELAELSAALKVLALGLSKIANDLRLMASGPKCGLNEIYLPAMQPGSSIMPGKVNPVIPEVVNQVAFQVMGNDQVISLAVSAGQFELNVMEPVLAYNLFNSLSMLTNAVLVFNKKCVSGIVANEQRCAELVDGSIGIITALLPHIGYEDASAIAREALTTGKPVKQIILSKGIMSKDKLNAILAVEQMTRPGIAGKQYMADASSYKASVS